MREPCAELSVVTPAVEPVATAGFRIHGAYLPGRRRPLQSKTDHLQPPATRDRSSYMPLKMSWLPSSAASKALSPRPESV
jgi:hypothetical protein